MNVRTGDSSGPRSPVLLTLVLLLVALPSTSLAAEFYAIIDDFGKKPLNAYIDVSIENSAGSTDVRFVAVRSGVGTLADFTVRTNPEGLASTLSVDVESFIGALGPPGTGTQLNPRLVANGVHKVDLSQSDALSNYIVQSTQLGHCPDRHR